MTAADLFGPGEDSGFVKIAASGKVAAFTLDGTLSGSAVGAAPGQTDAQAEFFFPGVDETPPNLTGIALLNDTSQQASVELFLIAPNGIAVGGATEVLQAGERLVKELSDEIVEAFNTKGGYLFVRSTVPLFGTAVIGVPDKTLNQLSARATLPGFVPPPLPPPTTPRGRLFITGTVRDFGTASPASGVTITLSRTGGIDIVTTTDASGAFAFNNLAAGTYTVTPTQEGRVFIPPSSVVELAGSGVEVNFERDILPILSGLAVVTTETGPGSSAGNNPNPFAVFGTSEVTLRIDGLNLAGPSGGRPGQTVFFGSRAIPPQNVSFVDAKTVFVRLVLSSSDILAELAAKGFYGSYDITIAAQAPFNATHSNALPFFILPPVPVLTSVDPEQTVARYEINSPGQPLTIRGFGFREGATLLFDNGTSVNGVAVGTTYVSSTELNAYLPAQALRRGGVYTLRVRNVSQLPEVSGEAVIFQVNNLRPQISAMNPSGPLQIIGAGPRPVSTNLAITGSNFFTETIAAITLKVPDIVPALVPVGGPTQCIPVNSQTVLRVRVIDASGAPAAGVSVTFTAPGIETPGPSGSFLPGNTATITAVSDDLGFAPPLADNESAVFLSNSFAGSYVVAATAALNGVSLTTAFAVTNLKPGDACVLETAAVTLVSSNQLVIRYSFANRGRYSLLLANPAPGGGTSNEWEFDVQAGPDSGVPVIRSLDPLSPASRTAGSVGFNLTVFRDTSTGPIFQPNAWVNFGTVRLDRIAGDTDPDSITVFVPSFLIGSPGIVPVTVTNPGTAASTGGTSSRVSFSVSQ
jgi:hypothetical protein